MRNVAYLVLLICAPLQAQTVSGSVSPDLATKENLEQVKAQMAATVAAAIPPICVTPPPPDLVAGTAGTAAACTPRADAAGSTLVMPSATSTAADGSFSGVWPGAFVATPTTAFAQAKTTTDPYTCQVGITTTSGYSGKCWKQTQVITLPSTAIALLNLQVTAAAPAPAGIPVMVVGRQ